MVRTQTTPRLTRGAAAAAAAARLSGDMAGLRFNPEINKIVQDKGSDEEDKGSDEEEREELVLHLARDDATSGLARHLSHVASATGRVAPTRAPEPPRAAREERAPCGFNRDDWVLSEADSAHRTAAESLPKHASR
eukprot:COSAG02_NODE_508_length_20916_cov_162.483691_3_plen_136_part_00